MKTLKESILSSTRTGKMSKYTEFPKNREELFDIIRNEINKNGYKCSLNHIDTSKITDMSDLFAFFKLFNGDISEWDVSNVEDMNGMFSGSKFNGDISKWKVRKVKDMRFMFYESKFKGNKKGGISGWDVSNVENMKCMFAYSKFNGDISEWDVSNVEDMHGMFKENTEFDSDISNWKVNPDCKTDKMFYFCFIEEKYKPFQNGERI